MATGVTAMIDEAIADGAFPGAALIVADGGRHVLEVVRGRKGLDGPPVLATTLYDVASLTKPLVTALLCLSLVEDGTLGWDDPTTLPGVTVRHLLTHSSGLPAWLPLHQGARGRAVIVERAAAAPRERPPGTHSVYSDLGFIVLGDLVERTAAARLDALACDRIFAPTGATRARFVDLDAPDRPDDVAATEGVPSGEVHDENCHAAGGILGHAGLFATAGDVASVLDALLAAWHGDPGARFGRAGVRAMWTPCDVPGSTWRLGWDGPAATGSSAGERWPKSAVGHLGFTGCSMWIDPPLRRYVVLLSNRVYPTRANDRLKAFRPRLHDAVLSDLGD
jgi:serine-type D-Ala-D-Ala carboxypeptidase